MANNPVVVDEEMAVEDVECEAVTHVLDNPPAYANDEEKVIQGDTEETEGKQDTADDDDGAEALFKKKHGHLIWIGSNKVAFALLLVVLFLLLAPSIIDVHRATTLFVVTVLVLRQLSLSLRFSLLLIKSTNFSLKRRRKSLSKQNTGSSHSWPNAIRNMAVASPRYFLSLW